MRYRLPVDQRQISIGMDEESKEILLTFQGMPFFSLPKTERELEICRNKVVNVPVGVTRSTTFTMAYGNEAVVVQVTHNHKVKLTKVRLGK